ncbi:dTDP-4-dehydrorhamnose reductase [Priestia koreensis]|uniref:dTDP-4-dehydrorhamnose reductase n=1 Tax=Priestia koreensis TaxID=284581 RepID=UPI001F5717F8|nr:dTDP-4-dehydrorhamnose reductase [Priestia koreensis]UNL85703.1 dTDP-4-dehydrorhamnose reductase [Priestia koreensis]
MKVIITGGTGQLGTYLTQLLKKDCDVYTYSKQELDITDPTHLEEKMVSVQPDVVYHCAAFTNVDQCEEEAERAFMINSFGARSVAAACQSVGAKMVYVSTDYIFDGEKPCPYLETDKPNPLNIYGKSKWLGERLVQLENPNSYIVRTSWLYGRNKNGFVDTMLECARMNKEVEVVHDRTGSPTYTKDLALLLRDIIDLNPGVYHVSNTGACSWYEFAQEIFERIGQKRNYVRPITSKDYRVKAVRPVNSALQTHYDLPLRHWKDALDAYMNEELFCD